MVEIRFFLIGRRERPIGIDPSNNVVVVSLRMMSNAARLKRFDAYAKTLDDFRIRTTSGGLVTIISTVVICILFLLELKSFVNIDVVQVLFVDTSRQETMNITIDLKFPALPCNYLTVDAMDISGDSQTDIAHDLFKTRLDTNGKILENEQVKVSLQSLPKLNETTTIASCESCYGAETAVSRCCPTCEDVRAAYRTKGWSFDPVGVHQCVREGKVDERPILSNEGCRIHGHLRVNKVSGNFHIAPGQSYDQDHVHVHSLRNLRLGLLNTSHEMNELTFGERFPNQVNPLSRTKQISHEPAILYHYYVKVVPTTYVFLNQTQLFTNQYSVTKHRRAIRNLFDSSDHQLPGTFFTYEISAIMVKFVEEKRSWGHFLTSLCAIIGGVFTVASLIDAFVYRSSFLFLQQQQQLKTSFSQ